MTTADKVFLFVMEACRADQLEALTEIAVQVVRDMLDDLPWAMRQEVIEQFREEDGIDVEEIL